MKKILLTSLFVLTSCQYSELPPELSRSEATSGIVGGKLVTDTDNFSQRVLQVNTYLGPFESIDKQGQKTTYYKVENCSGVALTPTLVLTAAHCLLKTNASLRTIEFKSSNGKNAAYQIEDFKIHSKYSRATRDYDVAVVKVKKGLPSEVILTDLPAPQDRLNPRVVLAAGYGRTKGVTTDPSGNPDGKLRFTSLPLRQSYIQNHLTFVVDNSKGSGFCQGDSGGPALAKLHGKLITLGIASRTSFPGESQKDSDRCSHSGIYINIMPFLEDIKDMMSELTP